MIEEEDEVSTGKGVEDMIKMKTLTQEKILRNLKTRYNQNLIYTNTGSILVSVNPFKKLPIYTTKEVKLYIGKSIIAPELRPPPHIFATAEACYYNMRENQKNQSVVISGESGSGKTEATKLILQFLAARTSQHSEVEQKILESSPLLEAFGNAKTVRNNNSSRFGKFIEIHFNKFGTISGARIIQYLLERSRLVYQAPEERNYHIFYQLLAGANAEEREAYLLMDISQYYYLSQSGCTTVDEFDDAKMFHRIKMAMSSLEIAVPMQQTVFKVLSGILRLGNIQFRAEGDGSKVTNLPEVEAAASLFGISAKELEKTITIRTMHVRGQTIEIRMKPSEAVDTRDALAKAIYSRLFDWLVSQINKAILKDDIHSSIGVLDIFGFENFKVNSFEQFCINFANEKLQQFFNLTIFKLEQEEYSAEKINWSSITFEDNQDCLDLIEGRPLGILSLLDEEVRFPKASDQTLLEKLNSNHKASKKYEVHLRSKTSFSVRHYAGEVSYLVTGFLDKNKDTLQEDIVAMLQKSSIQMVSDLFVEEAEPEDASNRTRTQSSGGSIIAAGGRSPAQQSQTMRKGPPTVGAKFRRQLTELMATLAATQPHYIRCIKPNTLKVSDNFDDDMVLAQLRYSGMLETIRIRSYGYPFRFPLADFCERYKVIINLTKKMKDVTDKEELIATAKKIQAKATPPSFKGNTDELWQIGLTKVFLKESQNNSLELMRNQCLTAKVVAIQSWWRMIWVRNYYIQYRINVILAQSICRRWSARKRFLRMRSAATLIQSMMRMKIARKAYLIALQKKREEEERKRREEEERRRREEEERKRREEEERRRIEEERKRKEEEERQLQERLQKMAEEERQRVLAQMKAEEEERKRKAEEAKRLEEEAKKKEEEEKYKAAHPELFLPKLKVENQSLQNATEQEIKESPSTDLDDDSKGDNDKKKGKKSKKGKGKEKRGRTGSVTQSSGDEIEEHSSPVSMRRRIDTLRKSFILTPKRTAGTQPMQFRPELVLNKKDPAKILSDRSEISQYLFIDYATQNFQTQSAKRRFSIRKKAIPSLNQLISYQKKIDDTLHSFSEIKLRNEALLIFKKLTSYMDSKTDKGYIALRELFIYGLRHFDLRDEIYCQIMKQVSNNPDKQSVQRGWEVLSACCGLFSPSARLLKIVAAFLMLAESTTATEDYAKYAHMKLRRLIVDAFARPRTFPPSTIELEANRALKPIELTVHMLDNSTTTVEIDPMSSACEVFSTICFKVHLDDPTEFGLYEVYENLNLERSMGPLEYVSDVLSKAERFTEQNRGRWEDFKIVFKKKLHLDPTFISEDPVENKLDYHQLMSDINKARLPCTDTELLIQMLAASIHADRGSNFDWKAPDARQTVMAKIPKNQLNKRTEDEWIDAIRTEYEAAKAEAKFPGDKQAILACLRLAASLPLYGYSIFAVQPASPEQFGFTAMDVIDMELAIGIGGIKLLNKETHTLINSAFSANLYFNQLTEWSYTGKGLKLVIDEGEGGLVRTLEMITASGIEIVSVIEDYVYYLREDSTHAKALQDYEVTDSRLLGFKKDDVILVTRKDANGWWTGELNGQSGLFPANMVEILILPPESKPQYDVTKTGSIRVRQKITGNSGTTTSVSPRNGDVSEQTVLSPKTGNTISRPGGALIALGMGIGNPGNLSTNPMTRVQRGKNHARGVFEPSAMPTADSGVRSLVKGGNKAATSSTPTSAKDDPTSEFPMIRFAEEFFNIELITGTLRKKKKLLDLSKEIIWTGNPISQPLLKSVDPVDMKAAKETFLNIMKYMGDFPTKKALLWQLMRQIGQTGIDNVKLRDEIFCQIIKQVTNNPVEESVLHGWEILAILCGLFQPGRELQPYLQAYLAKYSVVPKEVDDDDARADIGRLARAALINLGRIKRHGNRKFAPSSFEFETVRVGKLVEIPVGLMDGTVQVVRADMAGTVRELTVQLSKELKLNIKSPEWKMFAHYGDKAPENRFEGEVGDPLDDSANIMDVIAGWERDNPEIPIQFSFHRYVLLNKNGESRDPVSTHFLAHQTIGQVVNGRHLVSEDDAAYLGALQVRMEHEIDLDWDAIAQSIHNYIPSHYLGTKSAEKWADALRQQSEKHNMKSMNPGQAEQKYLEVARQWDRYGACCFFATRPQDPQNVMLAVDSTGFHVIHPPNLAPLESYPFSKIANWASSEHEFGVVVGSLMNPTRLVFYTKEGAVLQKVFQDHIQALVALKKKTGTIIVPARRPF